MTPRERTNARLVVSAIGTGLVYLVCLAAQRTWAIATGTVAPHGLDGVAVVTTLFVGVVLVVQAAVCLGRLVDWCADAMTAPEGSEPSP